MNKIFLYRFLQMLIGSIWLINGLFCKVFNLVPRHEQIVATILGKQSSREHTIAIGLAETAMAIWIFSGKLSRLNSILQMIVIGTMNILEFILLPELLLWGKWNFFFALMLILVIFVNEFYLKKKSQQARCFPV
ncbi:DoxX-like family protein [Pollutibacter soli]|uniref:DoxX-like family protein n=1 Tax=Pollutibacter soli TaxID=3034157 RepID=UPI003013FB74